MNNKLSNPFNITFGKTPVEIINRSDIFNMITSSFDGKDSNQLYLLVGPRGCGKTVTMTSISKHFKEEKKWIVIDINPHENILEQLAYSLYQKGKMKHLFLQPEFSISFKGFGLSLTGTKVASSLPILLEQMFEYLTKKEMNVLITIDEVNNNNNMKVFTHTFQSLIRNDSNVFLLMTGLYENISSLENEKSLTFLFRAPKIFLPPLSIRAITYSYMEQLDMDENDALKAAKLTNGYAFAYQLIGYILFKDNKKKVDNDVIKQFDLLLDENSYSKIYAELSTKEKEIVLLIANDIAENQEIMKKLDIKSNYLATYKNILSKKGIIDVSDRKRISFILPRFKEFITFYEKVYVE